MLLNRSRLLEGTWAMYSLLVTSAFEPEIVIHDDGTLGRDGWDYLRQRFPGCRVIDRQTADSRVEGILRDRGLTRCVQLRRTLIFGLKLFDPVVFAKTSRVLLLDSDILFFRVASEVLASISGKAPPRYMLDNEPRYVLSDSTIEGLLGRAPVPRFNPGIACVPVPDIDLKRIDSFLQMPEFWTADGRGDYYAELTLWAMELTLAGAEPLSGGYQICAPRPEDETVVAGHYCGGGYWAAGLYTRGVPFLWNHVFRERRP